jgi:hypothetical protein
MGKQKQKRKKRDLNPPTPMSTLRSGSIRSDLLGKQLLFQNPPKNNYKKKKKSYSDSSCA